MIENIKSIQQSVVYELKYTEELEYFDEDNKPRKTKKIILLPPMLKHMEYFDRLQQYLVEHGSVGHSIIFEMLEKGELMYPEGGKRFNIGEFDKLALKDAVNITGLCLKSFMSPDHSGEEV